MNGDTLDGMAMQVWHDLNAVVIDTEVRPHEEAADLVVRSGADHSVRRDHPPLTSSSPPSGTATDSALSSQP